MDRTINVSTNMSTQVPPDTINVDITIQGTSKTREECTTKYNELLQTMKDSLEQNGLSSSILKNNRYSISAHEIKQYQKEKWERYYVAHTIVEGFDFRAELSIKEQLETDLVEKIWKALSSCGDEVTFSVEFAIENEKPIKNKLSTDAIISCRQQANLLAKAAGAKVVGLQNATYDIKEKDFVYTACACSAYDDYESKNQVPAFDPSDIDVNCYVSTTWEIELLPPDDLL